MSTIKDAKSTTKVPVQIPFVKKNYMFMAGGFLIIVIAFFIMYVGVEDRGNSEVIYSFGKTSFPVLLIMAGFVLTGFGIMKRFK